MKTLLPQRWILQKIHISWHLGACALGVLIGTAIIGKADINFSEAEWLFVSLSGLFYVAISRARYVLVIALLSGGMLGMWRGSGEQSALFAYRNVIGERVVLTGIVAEDTSYGPKGDQRFKIRQVNINKAHYSGTVWVSTDKAIDIRRGDIIHASGKLNKGFGTISATMFEAKVDFVQRPVPGDVGRRIRDWFGAGVKNSMPKEEAQLALAFLVGQKLTVSDTLSDQLRTVGLIHAVVASGYHLTVLVGVIRRFFERISKYLTLVFSSSMIGGFIMITGFSPSMTRAGLVTGLGLIAWYYGRLIHPIILLSCTAAATVLYQPEYIWGDVGWYLSFAAFTGVLILAPLINEYFWETEKRAGMLREVLIATVAAQILTLPISIHVFGYYSAYALLANILVVPLIPITMLLTFLGGIVGLIVPGVAAVVGLPVVWILKYMISVVGWIAELPSSKTEVSIGITGVVISYVIICMLIAFLFRKTKYDFRGKVDSRKLF